MREIPQPPPIAEITRTRGRVFGYRVDRRDGIAILESSVSTHITLRRAQRAAKRVVRHAELRRERHVVEVIS